MPTEQRARRVTYGAVVLLLVAALTQVEIWPLSAYRLFSTVRTGTSATLTLVADGDHRLSREEDLHRMDAAVLDLAAGKARG